MKPKLHQSDSEAIHEICILMAKTDCCLVEEVYSIVEISEESPKENTYRFYCVWSCSIQSFSSQTHLCTFLQQEGHF
jgi:hypothetical protein